MDFFRNYTFLPMEDVNVKITSVNPPVFTSTIKVPSDINISINLTKPIKKANQIDVRRNPYTFIGLMSKQSEVYIEFISKKTNKKATLKFPLTQSSQKLRAKAQLEDNKVLNVILDVQFKDNLPLIVNAKDKLTTKSYILSLEVF